jgi:hypothetical protein
MTGIRSVVCTFTSRAAAFLLVCLPTAAGAQAGETPSVQTQRAGFFPAAEEKCLRAAVAGVITRTEGSGDIDLGGVPLGAPVEWAGLYWGYLASEAPANAVTLNGNAVTPVSIGTEQWRPAPSLNGYAYFADVTSLVVPNAMNAVAGLDDSGVLGTSPESLGASLVVVYEDGLKRLARST